MILILLHPALGLWMMVEAIKAASLSHRARVITAGPSPMVKTFGLPVSMSHSGVTLMSS